MYDIPVVAVTAPLGGIVLLAAVEAADDVQLLTAVVAMVAVVADDIIELELLRPVMLVLLLKLVKRDRFRELLGDTLRYFVSPITTARPDLLLPIEVGR